MASFVIGVACFLVVLGFVLKSRRFRKRFAGVENRWWFKPALISCSVGPFLLILVSSIIIYFLWIFPELHGLNKIKGAFVAVFCCYVWFNITFNYFAVMLTSAGKAFTVEELEMEGYSAAEVDICRKCRRLKCDGTHHCSTCQCCIRLLSHHCNVVNNCIGLNNFSYYYLFLVYSVIGTIFMVHQLYVPFYDCYLGKSTSQELQQCDNLGDIPVFFVMFAVLLMQSFIQLSFDTILLIMDLSPRELKSKYFYSSSSCNFVVFVFKRLFKRRVYRHRLKHLMWERKPYWIGYFVPWLIDPPIDLAAEDLINYEEESSHMV